MIIDLLDWSGGAPEAVALVTRERTWTFEQLDLAVGERAERLRAEGTRPATIVPLTVDPDVETILQLLALWRVGATPAPLNSKLTEAERDAASRALEGRPSDAQAVFWTSGTEGRPRGVAISYRNLAASALASRARLELAREDGWLASLSPAHVGGLALVTRALLIGCRLVVVGAFDAARTLELVADGAVTHASLVPTQLLRLLDLSGDGSPPDTFRCALIGGAHAPVALVRRALDAGWPLALTYGMTEATSQVATAPPALTRRKPGTVGKPLDGIDVGIAPDGEILVRGPTVAMGYLGAEVTDVVAPDGWLHTGDIGRLDDEGDLWVTGRRADRIVTGGVTVDAVEVEEALRAHPSVADACVVGLPDAEWGERVAAWVVPQDHDFDAEALGVFLRGRLSGPKLPRALHLDGELPRNPNGKVDRAAVRRTLEGLRSD